MEIETDKSAMGKLLRVEHRFFERPEGVKGHMLFQIDSDTQLVAPLWEVSSEAALNKALKDLETLSAEMMKDKPDYIIYVVGPKDEGSKEVGMFTAHQPVEFVRWVNPNEQ